MNNQRNTLWRLTDASVGCLLTKDLDEVKDALRSIASPPYYDCVNSTTKRDILKSIATIVSHLMKNYVSWTSIVNDLYPFLLEVRKLHIRIIHNHLVFISEKYDSDYLDFLQKHQPRLAERYVITIIERKADPYKYMYEDCKHHASLMVAYAIATKNRIPESEHLLRRNFKLYRQYANMFRTVRFPDYERILEKRGRVNDMYSYFDYIRFNGKRYVEYEVRLFGKFFQVQDALNSHRFYHLYCNDTQVTNFLKQISERSILFERWLEQLIVDTNVVIEQQQQQNYSLCIDLYFVEKLNDLIQLIKTYISAYVVMNYYKHLDFVGNFIAKYAPDLRSMYSDVLKKGAGTEQDFAEWLLQI